MPKQCLQVDCTWNVFGGGYCSKHQWLRTDGKGKSKIKAIGLKQTGKIKPSGLKRTPIKKVSKKQTAILGERKLRSAKDQEFFLSIWEDREHFCFETDTYLGMEPLTLYFHHVLEKSLYPQYRYSRWNIVLVCWEVHDQVHRKIDLCPKIKAYRKELLKKHDLKQKHLSERK